MVYHCQNYSAKSIIALTQKRDSVKQYPSLHGLRQCAHINYIYVFLQLQIFSYDEHLVSRNALFCGFPAECLLLHSYV